MYNRIKADEEARNKLVEALKRVIRNEDYISLTETISFGDFIEELYDLPDDYFGDVSPEDLRRLAWAILDSFEGENIPTGACKVSRTE
jgi:hypothetical protein